MDPSSYEPVVTVAEVACQLRAFANRLDQMIERGQADMRDLLSVTSRLRNYATTLDRAVSPDESAYQHIAISGA